MLPEYLVLLLVILMGVSGYIQIEKVRPFLQARGQKLHSPIFQSPHVWGEFVRAWKIAKMEGFVPGFFFVGAAANAGLLLIIVLMLIQ